MKSFPLSEVICIIQGTSENPILTVEVSTPEWKLIDCFAVYFVEDKVLLFDSWIEKDEYLEKQIG